MIKLKKKIRLFFAVALGSTLTFIGCTTEDPMSYITSTITNYGYMLYKTPLQYAGAGTLIGGRPDQLMVVSSPESCFPRQIDGISTNLYRIDNSTLPNRSFTIRAQAGGRLHLFNFLGNGLPSIGGGAWTKHAYGVEVTFKDVKVEYLDSVALTSLYRHVMPPVCKDYLDRVGFIIQALRVDQMSFTFFAKNGQKLELDVKNIEYILDIGVDVEWEIENKVQLNIVTPKYIGYQLGRLKRSDAGFSLYRATKERANRYIFEEITNVKSGKTYDTMEEYFENFPVTPIAPADSEFNEEGIVPDTDHE